MEDRSERAARKLVESTGHSVQLPGGDQKWRVETVGGKIAQTYIEGHKSRTKFRVLLGMRATAVPGPVPEQGHAGGTSADQGHEREFGDRESEAPLRQMGIWSWGLQPRGESGPAACWGRRLGAGGM